MKNIREMQNKSAWIINKIFEKLSSLNLRKYYFECALLLLNVILRSSILYASEAYYNVKETELRALEQIEKNFLRKLFKTTRTCKISQLYLEAGHMPARFEILKKRLLLLKNILNEEPSSMIQIFVRLQFENPKKEEWGLCVLKI